MINSLTNRDAIAIASNWIHESELDFMAAFIGGSVAYADPNADYDSGSDIDCYLVIEGDPPDGKIGKLLIDGVLLDVSWIPWQQLQNAENHAVLASLLHFGQVIRDPDGELGDLKHDIDLGFESPEAIAARLEDMRARIRPLAAPVNQSRLPQPEQVMNWLFPATLATHIPMVVACAPLTVRKRFLAAKRVMSAEDYEGLLDLYGFDSVTVDRAQRWLDETEILLDATGEMAKTSSRFWATDLLAKDIAIGGSQRLIDGHFHREALYWIIATSARCLTVMNDAGADASSYLPAFEAMTKSLGIATAEQRAVRTAAIVAWIG